MFFSTTPKQQKTVESLWKISKIILNTLDFSQVVQKVVDSLLFELNYLKLGYRIVVLTLIDEKSGTLKRISLSQTEEAKRAQEVSVVPFHEINIPLTAKDNLLIQVLEKRQPQITTCWPDIFRPILTDQQALINQKAAGIKTSMLYPVIAQGRPIGVLVFSLVKGYKEVTEDEEDMLGGFTDLVGLAVQNAFLYTSLNKTTLQLQSANQKLKELDRLKDDFVSITSHELRTPMTAIKSYLWMAANRPDINLSEKMAKYISRAYISTERLINLVNDMLNVSRIEAGRIEIRPRSFSILELVEDVIGEVTPKANEKNIQVYALKSQIPPVFADPDKIHQVLLNLIGNALKFTPEGGSITVNFFSDGQVVETSVKDTGVGVSKDDLSRLFEKFGRLDNSYVAAATEGGSGLGLYISKSLVELMHGKIRAASEGLGKGAVFTFSLPMATAQLTAQAEKYAVKAAEGEPKDLEPVSLSSYMN